MPPSASSPGLIQTSPLLLPSVYFSEVINPSRVFKLKTLMVLLGAFCAFPDQVVLHAAEALPPRDRAVRLEATLELTEAGGCDEGKCNCAKADQEIR